MTEAESNQIIKEVRTVMDKLTEFSQRAQSDSFLSCYDDSPTFLAISSDGVMRDYPEFKKICVEYYNSIKDQKIITIREKYHVMDPGLVILGWTGNIIAHLRNGDSMIMNNYSISFVIKKIGAQWKIIHSHESALPPEMIKAK